MKKLIAILGLALVAGITSVNAQTNTQAGTIVQSAEAFFGTFNTNYSWTNITIEIDSGYAQVTGVNAASKLNAQYDFGSLRTYDVDASIQFSGVGSAINAGELGAGWAFLQHYDTKAEAQLLGGYDNTIRDHTGKEVGSLVVEPGLAFKKKPTVNTYVETKLSLPVFMHGKFNSNPTIYAGVGFTY